MRYKKFAKMLFLSAVLFLGGRHLQSVYGFDPPYTFYFGGYVLKIISYILVAVTVWIIVFDIYKLRLTRKKDHDTRGKAA